ncbi:acyl-CoA synthetase [Rhodococcus sp. NPDC059968]|uniref:acyl-CoA synthetase n=1 Tax=Rhodococcus sp. NPDC059968 TaxID=3347017 RepID=UPI00366B6727
MVDSPTRQQPDTNMRQPGAHATDSDRPAVVMVNSGATVSYRELDERSKRLAQLLKAAGLKRGDRVAILLENHPRYFEVFWAAQRSGMHTVPINWHLKAEEAGYIVADSGASALIVSAALSETASELEPYLANVSVRLMIDGAMPGYQSYEESVGAYPATELDDEVEGAFMFYSSGTTGRPKGIKPSISSEPFGTGGGAHLTLLQTMYGFSPETVYLCPAPLYHAAGVGWVAAAHRLGATVLVMEKFDPLRVLQLIEQYRVTHAHFVPTHFVRMLKLPDGDRLKYDHSSLRVVVHAAAPCPVDVKLAMIDWWGPIICEFYAGSEGNGFCAINSEQWLQHRGSVGVPMIGIVHVLDEDGKEVPTGEVGQIWFEGGPAFEYHNDPTKTAAAINDRGWSTLGDVGRLDEDGFLYLTDRVSHMIISGGVNIYPQEIEDALALHPAVQDVAVVGVPHPDMGEAVKAVVVPSPGTTPGPELEKELIAHCRSRLAHYKSPTSVDFTDELPRLPTGKLLKREIRARYW